MFADDTNISCDGKLATDIQQKINSDLNSVHNWLLANKLTLSVEKTEYMIVQWFETKAESNKFRS